MVENEENLDENLEGQNEESNEENESNEDQNSEDQPEQSDEESNEESDDEESGEDDSDDDTSEDVVVDSQKDDDQEGIRIVVRKRNLRGSVKKFNLLTRLVGRKSVLDALQQLAWEKKRKAIIMRSLINFGVVRAAQEHDIPIERLRIENAIVSRGPILKRIRFHARGRVGKNYHRFSHLYIALREIPEEELQKKKPKREKPSYQQRIAAADKRAARRAANAAANAAAIGGQLVS